MVDLAEFKTQSYHEFIKSVIDMSESLYQPLSIDYFYEMIKDEISINIPTINQGIYNQTFNIKTTGELLYQFSQLLGDYDDAEELFGNHADFEGFIKTNDGSYNINCG